MKQKEVSKKDAVELTDGDRMVLAEFDAQQELRKEITQLCNKSWLSKQDIISILEQVKFKL